ncbi:MAG: FHA domain-containing protein [Gammaproteobacteria bacterium]
MWDAQHSASVDDTPRQRLCVMSGSHRGASCTLRRGTVAVIGQRDDCDVILSDEGVAPHHCIVSNVDDVLMVRAVDGAVTVNGHRIEPGDPRPLPAFEALELTDTVQVLVGEQSDQKWQTLLKDVAVRSLDTPAPPRRWPVATAAMFAIAASVTAAAMMLRDDSLVTVPAQMVEVKRTVKEMKLPEVSVVKAGDEIRVQGVVAKAAVRDSLAEKMALMGSGLDFAVRTGDEIASDVREVLRMSGLNARTKYTGAGEVIVSGAFEDEKKLAEALQSRAVLDVVGLVKVMVENQTVPIEKLVDNTIPIGKKIVAVVRGEDPYLVTADGARYYIGAQLPGGARLHDITSEDVWVIVDDEIERLDPEFSHVSRSAVSEEDGQDAPRRKR